MPCPQVHLVGVHREDLFLRVPLLDLKGEEHLLDFSFRRELVRQEQLSRELLRDRAGPAAAAASHGPPHGRHEQAANADAAVLEERTVLGRDERVAQHRRNVGVRDDHAPFGRELADDGAVASDDAGDRSRRVLVERRDLREVTGKARTVRRPAVPDTRGKEEERRDDRSSGRDARSIGSWINSVRQPARVSGRFDCAPGRGSRPTRAEDGAASRRHAVRSARRRSFHSEMVPRAPSDRHARSALLGRPERLPRGAARFAVARSGTDARRCVATPDVKALRPSQKEKKLLLGR